MADLARDALAAFDAATLGDAHRRSRSTSSRGCPSSAIRPTLVRAVANLLINAWKYTGEQKPIALQARSAGPLDRDLP